MLFKKKEKDTTENIKVKNTTKTKKKNKTNLGTKIFIWFMFLAMLASFIVPLLYYVLNAR